MTPKAGFTKTLTLTASLMAILLSSSPAHSWFGNDEPTKSCMALSAFGSIPLNNTEDITLHLPLKSSAEGDWSVLLLDSAKSEFTAYTLYRSDDGVWRGESLQPKVEIITHKNGKAILDFSSNLTEKEIRRMLVILVPRSLRGSMNVVPIVDKEFPTARTPIFYHTQSTMRGLVSHFDSLAQPVGHNIPIAPELSDQINKHSASGDLLIPEAYSRKIELTNVQAITVKSCNPN